MKFKCAVCDTEYESLNKYELSKKYKIIDFGVDIDEYEESENEVNIIARCQNCIDNEKF